MHRNQPGEPTAQQRVRPPGSAAHAGASSASERGSVPRPHTGGALLHDGGAAGAATARRRACRGGARRRAR
eukprot:3460057-Prymnesium_polylepis.1